MEHHEVVIAYRAQIAELYGKLVPRPTDEWIAEQVDRLMPLDAGAPGDLNEDFRRSS
jgi:hypothetical protein